MGKAATKVSGYKRALEGAWLAVIFLIPLFFNPLGHQAYFLNKILLLQFLVFIMLAFSVADWIHSKSGQQSLKWRSIFTSPLHLAIMAFGLLALIATWTSITPSISFWGSWGRGAGLLTLLCWILFFLIIAQQMRHRAQLFRAIYTLLLSSGVVAILGILQYYFPDMMYNFFHASSNRIFSTTGDALSLSAFLAMVIPLNMAFIFQSWQQRSEYKNKVILASLSTLLVLQFWCLLLAQYSVTVIVFIIGSLLFITLLGIINRRKLLFSIGAICLLSIVIMASLLVLPKLLSGVSAAEGKKAEDLAPIITAEELGINTLARRVRYWHAAVDLIIQSPQVPFSDDNLHSLRTFIGYGPETFHVTSQNFPYMWEGGTPSPDHLQDRPHNHYLYLAATVGLPGLVSFLIILAIFFYLMFRHLRSHALSVDKLLIIGLVAAMAQYIVDSLFNPSTPSAELVFWLVLGLTPIIYRLRSSDWPTRAEPVKIFSPTKIRAFLAIGCAVLLVFMAISLTLRPFLADIQFQKGLNLEAKHDAGAIFSFSKAIKIKPTEASYWGGRGAYVYDIAQKTGEKSVQTDLLAFSAESYEQAIKLEPYIAFWHYSLAEVYVYWAQQGAVDKWAAALSLYDKASQLFPDSPIIFNEWALALVFKGDYSQARTMLDYAVAINPYWAQTSFYAETSFFSSLLQAKEGKYDEAVSEIVAAMQWNTSASFIWFSELCQSFDAENINEMVSPLADALELYIQKVPDEWIPYAALGIINFFNDGPDKSLNEFNTAMYLAPHKAVHSIFNEVLWLSEQNPDFKNQLTRIAPDWRDRLSQSDERDTLLPMLDELTSTTTSPQG